MQIHELTQRQLLGEAGVLQGIKGAVQGFQQARGERQQTQQIGAVADRAAKAWIQYATNLKKITPDPTRYQQLYQQALTAFVQKNLLAGKRVNDVINAQELTQLITQMSQQSNDPAAGAKLFPKLVQQAALSTSEPTQTQSLVRVINTDPAVLQFRNRDYIINDQGEWADKTTGRVADQSFQAFLDQELAKVTPTAQQQTAPKPQQKIKYLPASPTWKNLDGVRGFQGKIWIKDKSGKWFDYNNDNPVEETRPPYIDTLNKLYDRVKPQVAAGGTVNDVLQQAGIDTARLDQIKQAVAADPAMADQLKKLLGL